MLTWLGAALLSVFAGVEFLHSLHEFLKTSLWLMVPFCVAASFRTLDAPLILRRSLQYLLLFAAGLGIAAIHSVLSAAAGAELPPKIPGALTESGQLVLIIPPLVGLILLTFKQKIGNVSLNEVRRRAGISSLLFCLLVISAWPEILSPVFGQTNLRYVQFAAMLAAGSILIHSSLRLRVVLKPGDFFPDCLGKSEIQIALYICTALLFSSLLLNLKRGPWFAVLIELLLIGALLSRRLFIGSLFGSIVILSAVEPARERLGSLIDHFLIQGGRSSMWLLGLEMSGRFPLGVGIGNSRYMRVLDPTIPQTHRHMHNNLLNLAVETGFLGLAGYLWWMAVVVGLGFWAWKKVKAEAAGPRRHAGLLALFISIALLGWQVSGLVEYNFGDGEIRLIALFLMGLLLALTEIATRTKNSGS